jgi:DNA-directed RNA polymerase specialized sigma24 family protein
MIEVIRLRSAVPILDLGHCVLFHFSGDRAAKRAPPEACSAAPPAVLQGSPPPGSPPPFDPPDAPDAPGAPPPARGRRAASLALSPAAARALVALLPLVKEALRRARVQDEEVADVMQEVLIRLLPWWAQRSALEGVPLSPRSRQYVWVVARNTARQLFRWRRVGQLGRGGALGENGGCASQDEETCPSVEEQLLEEEAAVELAREVDPELLRGATTPERWRAFRAHAVDGVPVAEIARPEQTVPATIYTRLALARRDLRAAILRRRAARLHPG